MGEQKADDVCCSRLYQAMRLKSAWGYFNEPPNRGSIGDAGTSQIALRLPRVEKANMRPRPSKMREPESPLVQKGPDVLL